MPKGRNEKRLLSFNQNSFLPEIPIVAIAITMQQ
jgi:hypothetical protein